MLVVAHSDKQDAAPTWKKTYGHHPLMGFVDHCPGGTGEPVAALLRPGKAGSKRPPTTSVPPASPWPSCRRSTGARQTLIRCDSAGGTHEFVAWLAQRGRWLSYSVGMVITEAIHQHVLKIPASAWTGHRDGRRDPRRRLGHRTHRRLARGLAQGHAADRPQGTAPPRCPVENHGRRRHADHRFAANTPDPADRRVRAPPPAAGPRGGPHPSRA
ncbi:transposase [Streptomyces spinoverrucosus]|uniref:transposase n=1 Tax=Streptomyces spinoverrucosus TaxID=284043 RepID=UPI003570EFE5